MMDDIEDDDMPLVFKRSTNNCKSQALKNQNQDRALNHIKDKKLSSPQNSHVVQKGKTTASSKASLPVNLSSTGIPKASTSASVTSSSKASASLVKRPAEAIPKKALTSVAADKCKEKVAVVTVEAATKQSALDENVGAGKVNSVVSNEDSDDEKPLSARRPLPESNDDSDDEKPLSAKLPIFGSKGNCNSSILKKGPVSGASNGVNMPSTIARTKVPVKHEEDDSDDEKPLASKLNLKSSSGASASGKPCFSDDKKKAPAARQTGVNGSSLMGNQQLKQPSSLTNKRPVGQVRAHVDQSPAKKPKLSNCSPKVASSSKLGPPQGALKKVDKDDDDIPLCQRNKKASTSDKSLSSIKQNVAKKILSSSKKIIKKPKKTMEESKYSKSSKESPSSGDGVKWTTLVHNGVIFPPPYVPHGIKMLYKGKPVDLTPEQEEIATMYAVMLDTDYMNNPTFKKNFFDDWRKVLGAKHLIQNLDDCNFTPIFDWYQKEKEKKKQMSKEERDALRDERLKQEEKYMWAIVDGVKEKVGNFRVEPPSIFRGRGDHPRTGKLKKRIRPSDITINIGKDAPIPECPVPGERWKEIRNDNTVTWLAFWNDPIKTNHFKYVFLAASSSLKGQTDKEKYEKARMLKDYIQGIRAAYTKDFVSKDVGKRQIAVATYLIDKLALRAGNEKEEDEADTVGCCTLKVENVEPHPPNILKFDFIGKDSIRYQNEVEVEPAVYKAIQQFRSGKPSQEFIFDKLDTTKLNAHLKELMPGLTAKVFRTYNASITLDEMLSRETKDGDVAEKVIVYQQANKEVAIICNHQRTVSKGHGAQMLRLNDKIDELKGTIEELKTDLARAKKGLSPLKGADGKSRRNLNPEALERKISQTNAKIEKMERQKETKEDLKAIALGTSKLNYLDPRITVAWCKRHEVPIEKIFNRSLLAKFTWAMDVDPSFRF